MYVCAPHVCKSLQRPEEGTGNPELELQVVVSCLVGFWKSNPGPLEEQLVFLFTKPFL